MEGQKRKTLDPRLQMSRTSAGASTPGVEHFQNNYSKIDQSPGVCETQRFWAQGLFNFGNCGVVAGRRAGGGEGGIRRDNMARVRRQKIRMLPHPTLSRWEKEKYERERHWILD